MKFLFRGKFSSVYCTLTVWEGVANFSSFPAGEFLFVPTRK